MLEGAPRDGSSDSGLVEVAVESVPGAFALGPRPMPPGASADPRDATIRAGLKDAGPLALAGFAANGANVVVTVVMARLLQTRGYGALAQLTALFLILSMPGTAITVGVVRRVTGWHAELTASSVWSWARRVHAQGTVVAVSFAAGIFAVRGPLSRLLSIPEPIGVFAILSAGAVWILLSFDRGLLQAHRNYRALSGNLLVEGIVRSGAVLVLVGAGFGVAGAAWGILIGELTAALHARIVADRVWSAEALRAGDTSKATGAVQRRRLMTDVAVALVSMGLLAWLQNIDVIILGRDAPGRSGSYAAISVASKALVFGAFVLGGYLLPEAAIRWRNGEHALRQLGVTMLVLGAPIAALLVAAVAFPHLLLSVVFSSRYLADASALKILVLAMACLSTTVVLTMYMLAAGQRWIAAVLGAGAVGATVAVGMAHGRATATTAADLLVQALLLGVTAVVFVAVHRRRSIALAT